MTSADPHASLACGSAHSVKATPESPMPNTTHTITHVMAWIIEGVRSADRITRLSLSCAVAEPCRSFAPPRSNASRKALGKLNS
jgi:hypothetical protein